MRLTRQWREKTKLRPKVRPLTRTEQAEILRTLEAAVAASPLLSAFDVKVRLADGRFYVERKRLGKGTEIWGRITPLANTESADGGLLLEAERANGQWFKVATGEAATLVQLIASDTSGTFHGLGALDASLRRLPAGQQTLPVVRDGCGRFVYADTGKECSVQEALFHYFGLPVEVIAKPCGRNSYHRRLKIIESSRDRTRVLVWFTSESISGMIVGGTASSSSATGDGKPTKSKHGAVGPSPRPRRRWLHHCPSRSHGRGDDSHERRISTRSKFVAKTTARAITATTTPAGDRSFARVEATSGPTGRR